MKQSVHRFLTAVNLLLLGGTIEAQVYESSTNVCFEGESFHEDSVRVAQDDKWGTTYFSTVNDYQVKDIVKFKIIENPAVVFPDSFKCTVYFNVIWWDSAGTLHNEGPKQLSVNYNAENYAADTLISYYTFYGAYKDSITITNIDAVGFPDTVLPVFRLESSIEVLREYPSWLCLVGICDVSHVYQPNKDELLVSWNDMLSDTIPAYDEVELEWTFYDDSSAIVKQYGSSIPYSNALFHNNATRVVIKENTYSIPLLYERGYLAWRVRPVRIVSYGQRKLGQWTTNNMCGEPASSYIYRVDEHQNNLNWQSTISFAEEGKRKSVISYFDGASKNRQSVTKLNTNDIAIVAETLYDNEGRDVVSTLPAPTISSVIKHFTKFNINRNDSTYSWTDLDSTGSCTKVPRVMKTDSGASRYYSPANPNRDIAENRYIPDADGYPFSQKQYTGDLTGRIRRTAGAGSIHKMGANRETTYYYGTTSEAELKRLFGNQAGSASHYFKNLQKDPNGQVSVTYLDMHGRTIATALAGKSISVDMDSLPSFRPDTIIRDAIIDTASQFREGLSLTSSKTFLVSTDGVHKFCYSLLPNDMRINACDSALYCFDCIYDLRITITGDCNTGSLPYVFVDSNYVMGEDLAYYFDTTCANSPAPIIDSFNVSLPVGEYTITKKLSIKPQALEYYYGYYTRNDSCVKTFSDFYDEALSKIDASGCIENCEQCRTALGDSTVFIHDYIDKILANDTAVVLSQTDTLRAINAYLGIKKSCDILCEEYSICEQKSEILLFDMSPHGGQYTIDSIDENTGEYIIPADPTSVFSTDNSVYGVSPYNKTVPLYADPSIVYTDEYGQADTLFFDFDNDGIIDTACTPNQLPPDVFIQNWKDSWADALLPYHPEYCYWEFCNTNEASNRFDALMRSTSSYDSAVAHGLLNPLGMSLGATCFADNGVIDPFFSSGGLGHGKLGNFQNRLTHYAKYYDGVSLHYLSVWDISLRSVQHDATPEACHSCKKDYYWNLFRNIYLGRKQMFVDSVLKQTCSAQVPSFSTGYYQGKQPRMPLYSETISDIYAQLGVDDPDDIDTLDVLRSAQDSIDNNGSLFTCRDYISSWWASLRSCGFTSSDSLDIIPRLVAVCEMGRDFEHPLGASTTPPDSITAFGDTAFAQVISDYRVPSDTCSVYLITNPLPYGNNTAYYQSVIFDIPDSCICGNINMYHTQYLSSGFSGSFHGYLNNIEHITISEEDIYALKSSCDSPVCDMLKHPVSLPYAFECNRTCVNCFQLVSSYNNFRNTFPNILASPNYYTLLASYMNQNLAMNLTATEYVDFMHDSCGYTFPENPTPVCNAPNTIDDYFETSGNSWDTLDILSNDSYAADGELTIIRQPTQGIAGVSYQNDIIIYVPDSAAASEADTLVYSVCRYCSGSRYCDTATVYINAGGGGFMMMRQDSGNDFYKTPGVTNPPSVGRPKLPDFIKNMRLRPDTEAGRSSRNAIQQNNISCPDFSNFFRNGSSAESALNKLTSSLSSISKPSSGTPKSLPPAMARNEQNMGGMMLMEGGSPGIGWQPTWCDSIAASLLNYDTLYVQPNQINPYSLQGVLNSDLGGWYSFPEWVSVIDSCGLSCPPVIHCSQAQAVLNDFYTAYPAFQHAAPASFLSHYLNSRGASGLFDWINSEDWGASLQCCGIMYPHDTAVAYCDQLQAAVNGYDIMAAIHGEDYWGFGEALCMALGWQRYTDSSGLVDNDLQYWVEQMDSCGISCSSLVDCTLLQEAMDSFYAQFPHYNTQSPPELLSTYLNVSPAAIYDESPDYGTWRAIAGCCGIGFPEADTSALTLCDSAAITSLNIFHIKTFLGINSCLPTFIWGNLLRLMSDDEETPVNPYEVFALLDTCGYQLPDTCASPVVLCDSLLQVYSFYVHLDSLSGGDISLSEIIRFFFEEEMSDTVFMSAVVACDSSVVCSTLEEFHNIFAGMPCVTPFMWVSVQNALVPLLRNREQWESLYNYCSVSLPDFCDDVADNLCDTLRAIYEVEQHFLAVIEDIEDPAQFREDLYSLALGYPVTTGQVASLLHDCGVDLCAGLQDLKDKAPLIYPEYDNCVPAWTLVIFANSYEEISYVADYEQLCRLYDSCGIPCPDTCHNAIGATLCDTLAEARIVYDRVRQTFGVDNDDYFTDMLEFLVSGLLNRYMPYQEIMDSLNSCYPPRTIGCDTLGWLWSYYRDSCNTVWIESPYYPETYREYCIPNKPIGSITYNFLGVYYTLEQFIEMAGHCPHPAILCGELDAAFEYYNLTKTYAELDSVVWLSHLLANWSGTHIMTYNQVLDSLERCNCEEAPALLHQIYMFLGYNPNLQFEYSQEDFDYIVYNYLDSVNGYHIDWCGLLTNCGYDCPTVLPQGPLLCNRPLLPPLPQPEDSCLEVQREYAYHQAAEQYNSYIRNLHDDFMAKYADKCLQPVENLEHERSNGEFHFTLYYYDQAGNLVKTVPPAGVNLADPNNHSMATTYLYNTANQVVIQETPDAGISETWYDKTGLPVFSQNARQKSQNQISYTKYDNLKRITEVGQYAGFVTTYPALDDSVFSGLHMAQRLGEQVTKTFYDEDTFHLGLANLRNRVASMTYEDADDGADTSYLYGTHYSYDYHGNVAKLKREIRHLPNIGQALVDIDYRYDLISGKVNEVAYMRHETNQSLWHKYEYDADNRLTDVYTSQDSTHWEHDAHYRYYLHGPLARVVLGDKQVQGTDYAYTLQGWIKTMNSSTLSAAADIGNDGNSIYGITAQDEAGYTLGYYTGDYKPIATGFVLTSTNMAQADRSNLNAASLYNGNIGSMEMNIGKLSQPLAYRYRYDQLNRLKQSQAFDGLNITTNTWGNTTPLDEYATSYQYDPNGNIMKLNRNGAQTTVAMDSFTYHYQAGTNKLDHVSDAVSSSNYTVDIDNQSSGNYQYDAIGNLIKDEAGCIDSIRWTVYGKVWKVFKCTGDSITFAYAPTGDRILKEYWNDSLQRKEQTYYLRDATGNEMAMYKYVNEDTLMLEQQPIYGSSRLGVLKRNELILALADTASIPPVPDPMTEGVTSVENGRKVYELTDHLGDVLATVNDRKLPVYESGTFHHYKAEVMTANDYFPFGMAQPQRGFEAEMSDSSGFVLDSPYVFNEQYDGDTVPIGWASTNGHSTLSVSGGNLVIAATNAWSGGVKSFTTVPGKTYRVRYSADFGSSPYAIMIQVNSIWNAYSPYYPGGVVDYTFTATATTGTVTVASTYSAATFSVDYITIQQVTPDTIAAARYWKEGYRYSFNGKEDIDEVIGWQDYGERYYDRRLNRFISPDPLIIYGTKYPELSSYQFASNSPIMGIDLDGLELFPVHGTWSNYCDGFSVLENENFKSITAATNNTRINPFEWSGYNSDKYRKQAANALVAQILDQRKEGEPITIVGHSHGGNVSIMAANMLNKKGVTVDYLITINTPVREYQLDENSPTKQIQIFNYSDEVQKRGGNSISFGNGSVFLSGEFGKAGRTFDNATNIAVPTAKDGGIKQHNSQNHPEFWSNQLKETISPSSKPMNTNINYKPETNKATQDNTKVYHNPNARF